MTTTIPAGHPLEGKADLIIGAGEQVDAATTGIDDRARRLGRCAGTCARTGLVWRAASGMTLARMRCPVCDGRVRQTTNSFRARFYRLTADYVATTARTIKEAERARSAELVAAGAVKRVKDLEPGDVIMAAGHPGRVVEVLGAGEGRTGYKSRVGVLVARTVDDVANYSSHSVHLVELKAAGAADLLVDPDRFTWADLEPGRAMIAYADKRAAVADRQAASLRRDSRSQWASNRAADWEAEAAEYRAAVAPLKAAACAALSRPLSSPAGFRRT